jgi:hypothetical protein
MLAGPYVINLTHRKDRLKAISKEFQRLDIPFHRIDAVADEDGAAGCMKSHINALKDAPAEAAAVWICEDDAKFLIPGKELKLIISAFMASKAEVLCLGYNSRKEEPFSTIFTRTTDNQTRTAYIVKASIRKYLVDLWESVLEARVTKKVHPWKALYQKLPVYNPEFERGDQCWKILQQDHYFVIPYKRVAVQAESYSDIEKEVVNYEC